MKWKSSNNNNSEPVQELIRTHSVLSPTVVITGEIVAKEDLRIDGNVKGNINCEGKIIIGPKGCVVGNIECNCIELMGQINGDVLVHDIFILRATSHFKGEVNTANLEIEPGAHFFGNCKMKEDKQEESFSSQNTFTTLDNSDLNQE